MLLTSIWETMDRSEWGREHWKLFIVVSLTFFLNGLLFALSPSIMHLVVSERATEIFSVNLASYMLGSLALGRLTDLYGRRVMLVASISIYATATFLLIPLHGDPVELLILTSAINFGIGGVMGAAYSAIAEFVPARHRGKAMLLATNMWNVGGSTIACLALYYKGLYSNIDAQIRSIAATAAALASLTAMAGLYLPESPRWLAQKGRYEEAVAVIYRITGRAVGNPGDDLWGKMAVDGEKKVGLSEAIKIYRFRLIITITMAASGYITYDIISYYAPYARGFAYSGSVELNIAVANFGAALGAFLLIPLIDRSRKASILISYLGGTVSASILAAIHGRLSVEAYLAVVFIDMIFSEWAWASIVALESELFPTNVRASIIGFITFITSISSASVIYSETYIPADSFLALGSIIWALGLAAAIAWYVKGVESARGSVEELTRI